ncbi:MAG: OB-fold domain-containing protein [Dehalococcoidales bacterium]|nr:hypothetical protein [Dehalococcoidales bacterium]MDO8687149.1 OB-fold domain-containing protein [Dehalococcoidales bacterium]
MPYMPDSMPIPNVEDWDTKEFWAHCKKHELVVQRCTDCGTFRHSPQAVCFNCQSWNYEWKKVSGKGVVFSYIICHYPAMAAVKTRVPYNVVLVELEDAGKQRMLGNLIDGTPNEDIHVGMPVEVTWEDIDDTLTLPQWKRSK